MKLFEGLLIELGTGGANRRVGRATRTGGGRSGEIVEVEPALHVLERALQASDGLAFGIFRRRERQRLRGLGPWLIERHLLGAARCLAQDVRGQRFGPQSEMDGLFRCEDAERAPPFQPAVEAQFGRKNGRESHEDEGDDERHPLLLAPAGRPATTPNVAPQLATSIRRRILPQSLNSMVTSTATGRARKLSGGCTVGGGHAFCQA